MKSKRPSGPLQHPLAGLDHGQLTDHNGKKIDFRNVILIMTTNAGAADMQKAAIGFGSSKREGEDVEALTASSRRNSATVWMR